MAYKWTFMVYMAGDNGKIFDDGMQLMDNLVGFGWNDIKEGIRTSLLSLLRMTFEHFIHQRKSFLV